MMLSSMGVIQRRLRDCIGFMVSWRVGEDKLTDDIVVVGV